jgi:5-methylcytosine-specific restriction endonuclease McrA
MGGHNKKEINLNKMRELASSGESWPKIAKHFGVSEQTIYRRFHPHKAREHTKASTERQRRNKRELVEYKGGECCICSYKDCDSALDFHHLRDKSFTISSARGRSLDNLKKEADKTILVCRNCHAEVHEGMHAEFIKLI